MKLIKQNPFRILGITVNAGAKDLAANKSKMRLLDIGKEVTFPLDLPDLLSRADRTKETVALAERNINLPQDKVQHALFWLAQPSDPIGKFGFDRLLQGDIDNGLDKLGKSNSWEAQLCVATLYLAQKNYAKSLSAIAQVIDQHSTDLVAAVAGQTFKADTDEVFHIYLTALSSEINIADLYLQLNASDVPSQMLSKLQDMAVGTSTDALEKEIADAKAVNNEDAAGQLKAGRSLMQNASTHCLHLKQLVGESDIRYTRMADKLANQILQCSINYHNIIDNSSDLPVDEKVIDDCLQLAEYALTISVGKIARERIEKNIEVLRDKKQELPPDGVKVESVAIMNTLKAFVEKPKKIEHAMTLLTEAKPQVQLLKDKLGDTHPYYLHISTLIVNAALSVVIDEINHLIDKVNNSVVNYQNIVWAKFVIYQAWECFQKMDSYDMQSEFRTQRYLPNRNTLQELYNKTSNTESGRSKKTNWGCIVAIIIAFILFLIFTLSV